MRKEAPKQIRFEWKKVLSILQKVLYVLLLLLCAFLLVVVVWLAVDKFIVKSPIPSFAGYSLLSVESGSMEGDAADSIAKKDLILIRKSKNYQIGDTVTYLRPEDKVPTTHRIIGFDDTNGEREYITRGDANGLSQDANVTKDMIFGKVVVIFGGVGLFRSFITEGGGYVFLITSVVILIAGIVLWRMVEQKEQTSNATELPKEDDAKQNDANGEE